MNAAPSATQFGWLQAGRLVKSWIAWVAASAAGGWLSALVSALGFGLVAVLTTSSHSTSPSRAGIEILPASFFIAAGMAALPQALLLSHGAAPGRRRSRALGWIAAGAVGGLLGIGYLLYDNTSFPTWEDLTRWYIPITLVVSLLVAGAQGIVLKRILSPFRLLLYVAMTLAGWTVGWSVYLLDLEEAWVGAPRLWAVLGPVLSYAVPMTVIGAASGLALAPALARQVRNRALPASVTQR